MLSKIIHFSIHHKLLVGLLVIALVGVGIYNVTKLPIDAVPDITDNQVQVITSAPSYGATDIERLVTFPIEMANSNINGLKEMRSFSRFGLSLVTLVFEDHVDLYWARQQVAERLQQVQSEIPKNIGAPALGPITTGLGEIYQYVVRPKKGYEKKYNAMELRTIQDWIVRRQLLGVKGVAEVSSFGGYLKQYDVAINSDKLNAYNLTMEDIFKALEANNSNTGGSYIERGPTVLYIRSEGLIGSKEDIENIAVKELSGGLPIYIRDVGEVQISAATRYGAMCYNDEGEVSGAVVMMLKGANSNEVIKNVKERVSQIQKNLPEGVVIEPFLDRTKMVNNAISTVEKNLLEGALIVVFILVIFLGNLRAGLLVASVIPLSMLFAITMMNIFGVSGNLMSLGALDFGLIVDGAVIIVEAVLHQLGHKHKLSEITKLRQDQMDEEVSNSASKMMNSAVFGQVIILIVYLPILTLQGIEGKMFKPMAQTVAFALLGAFILSLTYIPMMSAFVLNKNLKKKPNLSDRVMAKIENGYGRWLNKALQQKKMILGAVGLAFVGALFILSRMGGEFIPSLEEGDFAVDTRVLTGSNLNTTIAYTQKAAHVLKSQFPEVEKVVTKIGSGEVPTDPMPMEASDMMVILKPKKEWTSAKTFPQLSEKMSEALSSVPGITAGFQYPVQMRFNELMTGARQDVVCKIFGENLDTLTHYAHLLGKVVLGVDGAQNLFVEPITGMPQIIISYNRLAIARYGLSIDAVNRLVNTAFAGQTAGQVFEGEKRFDLILKLDTIARQNINDVRNLLVPTSAGIQIPLHQLAQVNIVDGPNQIQREDAKRRIIVGFNVRNRDVQSTVHELQDKVEKRLKLPAGYYVTYGGSFENLNEAKARLSVAVPVSLLLILILLYFTFRSLKQGLLIYTAIPLSAIGGILFLALRGMPFSISAGVGFIALFGVAVLNGIVMISEFNRIRQGGETDLRKIVFMGARTRLRPILMTAFVASLGFLPMALSNGAGAEVQRPLATVVIGGLLIATFLTLFVLPILYILFETIKPKSKMTKTTGVLSLLLIMCFSGVVANAQQPIGLQEAINLAQKNNLALKNEKLMAEYQAMKKGTAVRIPRTRIGAEVGQVNGYYFDNKVTIEQGFSLPQVYRSQENLIAEEARAATLNVAVAERDLSRSVAYTFYKIINLKNRKVVLNKLDSLYGGFLQKADLRLQKGESNILETTSAKAQRDNIRLQQIKLNQDLLLHRLQFQLLLNTDSTFEPAAASKAEPPLLPNFSEHPKLQQLRQQIVISEAVIRTEKAKNLPDFSVQYSNQSFRGMGPNDVRYSATDRFHSYGLGVELPLFNKAQKRTIKLAEKSKEMAEQKLWSEESQLANRYQAAAASFALNKEAVAYMESNALKNAQVIWSTAQLQYFSGEINYLEWVLLTNQAVQMELEYLNAQEALYESISEIYFFNN